MNDLQQMHELTYKITPREMEIVKEMAEGSTTKQIAEKLGISFKTVNVHRYSIMQKTKCKNSIKVVVCLLRAHVIA